MKTLSKNQSASEAVQLEASKGKGLALVKRPLPPMEDYQVEIEPAYSYISAGTELSMLQEVESGTKEAVQLGYSLSGTVIRTGKAVDHVKPGQEVVAIGAGAFHASRVLVGKNLVSPLPEGVCLRHACMAAMFCFALEGVYKSQARIGQKAVVFGAGMMGQLTARLMDLSGVDVAVMDTDAFRLGLVPDSLCKLILNEKGWDALAGWAKPYGLEHVSIAFGGDASDVVERIKSLMVHGPDGVPHGRIVFPGGAVLSAMMVSNMGNIQFLSSAKAGPGYRDSAYESGHDYPSAYVSHPVNRNLHTYLELLRRQRIDVAPLITHEIPFSQSLEAYNMLRKPGVQALAVLLAYRNDQDPS